MPIIPFSNVSYSSSTGRLLRWLLSWIPSQAVVPILQGPLRGMRWIVGAQTHGMWLGSYEILVQNTLANNLKPGQVFYDVGANVGFYTLFGAKYVMPEGKVFAFEPLPRNLAYLNKHITLNSLGDITVVPCAVSNYNGDSYFQIVGNSTSHLAEAGQLKVKVITLDGYVSDCGFPPDVVKVDIEGAEIEFLEGAKQCLSENRPIIVLAVHSEQIYRRMFDLMRSLGYRIETLQGDDADERTYQDEVILKPE